MATAEVLEFNETARERLIRMVDQLMFDDGDQREAFGRTAKAVNADEALLQELWEEIGPSLVSYVWRASNGGGRRAGVLTGLLNPGSGERVTTQPCGTRSSNC